MMFAYQLSLTVIVDYLLVITLHTYDNIKRLATNVCDFTVPRPSPQTICYVDNKTRFARTTSYNKYLMHIYKYFCQYNDYS